MDHPQLNRSPGGYSSIMIYRIVLSVHFYVSALCIDIGKIWPLLCWAGPFTFCWISLFTPKPFSLPNCFGHSQIFHLMGFPGPGRKSGFRIWRESWFYLFTGNINRRDAFNVSLHHILIKLAEDIHQVSYPVGITPFVIIPIQGFYQTAFDYFRERCIENR